MLHDKLIKKCFTILTVILLSFAPSGWASKADLDAELKDYINSFSNSGFAKQRKAIDSLGWAGISDPRLYDIIESKLLADFQSEDKQTLKRMPWYAKALGLSGNDKYQATLEKVLDEAESRKIRKHSKLALQLLDRHKQWNPVITQGLAKAPTGRLEQTRVSNMIKAEDPALVRIGDKRVYYAHGDSVQLLNAARDRLLKDYQAVGRNKDHIDAVAWLCKALANSGKPEYRRALETVADNAENKKVAKYAKKYAGYL